MEAGGGRGLRIVGVLGGVGSGKSTAARALADALGAIVLDADAEVAALLAEPAVLERLEAEFGPGLRSGGRLDRKVLGQRVFSDPGARRRLEALLHPEVRRAFHRRLQALEAAGGPGFVVLDVPLLVETGLDALCDFLVYVSLPDPERERRACARHGWSGAEWAAREAAQRSPVEKRGRADAILDNSGGVESLRVQAQALITRIQSLPARPLRERWPVADQPPRRQAP